MSNLSDIKHELSRLQMIPTPRQIEEASEELSQSDELTDADGELQELYFQQR